MIGDWWYDLSPAMQDSLTAFGLVSPAILIAAVLLPGHAPGPLALALARRHWAVTAIFVALIAVSVALGTGLLAQERAIRAATARAADPFDIIVAAPGSELTVLFATVFLRPSDMGLVGGTVLNDLAHDERVSFVAPVGFGDSVGDAPIVGTTVDLVKHLAKRAEMEGRVWTAPFEAIVGSALDAQIGDNLQPAHGLGAAAEAHAHEGSYFQVVGRMPRTGSPWDRAVIVPIEALWQVHGLADGHREAGPIGPPYVPDLFPGAPAIVVGTEGLSAAYSLRSDFDRQGETMAFFPGAVLAQLYGVMGDVRGAMSVMANVTQLLVAAGALSGLAIVARLFRRQLALLSALGASRRFITAVIWVHALAHLVIGAILGVLLGFAATAVLSGVVAGRTNLAIRAQLGTAEILTVCAFLGLSAVAALIPALGARSPLFAKELR